MEKEALKVLVVDDELMMGELIDDVIREMDGHTYYAKNGQEALSILEEEMPFSLMITDLQMPQMDGEALIDFVTKRYKDLPIIVMSSFTRQPERQEVLLAKGVREVLRKPLSVLDLKRAVERQLDLSEPR